MKEDEDLDDFSERSESAQEDKQKEPEKIVEPVEQKPQYSDEDLEKFVKNIQKYTMLYALKETDWSQKCLKIIKQWLLDVSELLLTIFYDGDDLSVCLAFPLAPVADLTYFLREPNQIFTVDGFNDEILYGTIHEDVDGTLLSILENFYAPIIFSSKLWTDSVKLNLCEALHKFLAYLTSLHYKISGITMLYVPREGIDKESRIAAKDHTFLKRLETIAVHWISSIRKCLTDTEKLVPNEVLCPLDEYEFWVYRFEILQGLELQLKMNDFKHCMEILEKAQSIFVKQLYELFKEIDTELDIANNNVDFLQILIEPCRSLNDCESPADIPPKLSKIMQLIRIIWTNSKHYNTNEIITALFRMLSNQIILICRSKINVHNILNNGTPRFGIKIANISIDCCLAYKMIYNKIAKEHNDIVLASVAQQSARDDGQPVPRPKFLWNLNFETIFNHVDAFIQRLYDFSEICETIIVFGRCDETMDIPPPIFGGNRGPEFDMVCIQLENTFKIKGLESILNAAERVLDVHDNAWYDDVEKFRILIKELDEIIENLITNVFLSICNVEEGIEGLCSLYYYSVRKTLRPAYIRKTTEVWSMYQEEINLTNKLLLHENNVRPSYLPNYAGRAINLKINLNRITRINETFVRAEWLPENTLSFKTIAAYEKMKKNFTKTITSLFEEWLSSLGLDITSKLNRTLMCRSISHSGLLECNIHRGVLDLCEEARHFELAGFVIPVNVNQIFSKYDQIRLVYDSVVTVVLDYNRILSALSDTERILFRVLIETCDRKIRPGIIKLTWGSEMIDAYITECVKHTGELQEFVDLYKKANQNIVRICEKICDTPLIKFNTTSIVKLSELVQAVKDYRIETALLMFQLYDEIVDMLIVVYDGFKLQIDNMPDEWLFYIKKMDSLAEEAFRICAKNTLEGIYNRLHGDSTMGPTALIEIEINLKENILVFSPTISEINQFIGNLHYLLLKVIRYFRRIVEKFQLEDVEDDDSKKNNENSGETGGGGGGGTRAAGGGGDDGTENDRTQQFYKIIQKDPDCEELHKMIGEELLTNQEFILNYLLTWNPFKALWELDKDEFMECMSKTLINANSFDENISRYKEISNQVGLQENFTRIHFVMINSTHLKKDILLHIENWQTRFMDLLKEKSIKNITDIYQYMSVNVNRVAIVPKTIVEMQETIKFFDKITSEIPVKEKTFPNIKDYFKIIDKYEIVIPNNVRQMENDLDAKWQMYLNKLKEAEEMLDNCKDTFKLSLLKDTEDLKVESKALFDSFSSLPFTSATSPTNALLALQQLRNDLQRAYDKEAKLTSDLAIFGINIPENLDLRKLDKELKILEEVWNLAKQWEDAWIEYKTANFWEIKTDEMEDFAVTLFRRLNRLSKQLQDRNWEILETTRRQVDEFRRTLPLLTALKNPAMRDRHWDHVRELILIDFDEKDESFNLGSVVRMNFQKYSEEIMDISNAATMELQIENGLNNIKSIWKIMHFEMQPYKEDIYRLKNLDDCFQALEDNSVQISAMKATRFVEPFSKEVDEWEKTLNYILESLENALMVQRQWLYLENIFQGEDIRKQLPNEAKSFQSLTDEWKEITTSMYFAKTAVQATHMRPPNYLLDKLILMLENLELIQRALEIYLESKRQLFPRFYFISNDDLLEILGNSRKPDIVQPHLKKLFDNLNKCELYQNLYSRSPKWEARGMYSADGEFIKFARILILDGPVEKWLNLIETAMHTVLKDQLRLTRQSLRKTPLKRDKWLSIWPGQLCLTSAQILWTSFCTISLQHCKILGDKKPLKKLLKKQNNILGKLSELSRKELEKQMRLKVNTLITIEIHGRDVIEKMYKMNCRDVNHFEWFSQLRFYWERLRDDCTIRQTNTLYVYGYEYTGNSGRLVITPLTDRCYITLTTALHLNRGGSPKGPAGTGKTETVKDLGKALGMWVIVNNCSEGLDYKSMGKSFSGLSQTGAWGCFDEFNRINIEVLSVVAQQILSILTALGQKQKKFLFEGQEIKLVSTVGLFITMNPGYAGRTELPDNLKSMFRPISMIVPDNIIIAENLLFSDGFQMTKILAKKVFTLYELAKQQLSKQHHYDFGLRSMVALLRYGGMKRRQFPSENEEKIIYLAMKDMNIAKFTAADLPLFNGIMSDIFPGVSIPVINYESFLDSIKSELLHKGLQIIDNAITKVIQLFETKNSRHSVMILGGTGTAKTVTWQTLKGAFNRMQKIDSTKWVNVIEYPVNPKSLSLSELYGEYNLSTGEWYDGVLSSIMRKICADESVEQKWMLFDGPVDAVWIENMNSVMDDNKVLTLVNSERITMPAQVSLLFEVGDLTVASPATVSRCGMVYNDYNDWGWRPYINSWLQKQKCIRFVKFLNELLDRYLDLILEFKRHKCKETVVTNELNNIQSFCRLMDCLATKENGIDDDQTDEDLETLTKLWFLFCLLWSVCGTVDEQSRLQIDSYMRELEGVFPLKDTVYDYFVDPKQKSFIPWEEKLSSGWRYPKGTPFYKIIVPTIDTIRYNYLVIKLLQQEYPVLLVGAVGTGKSSTATSVLNDLDPQKYSVLSINMSAQTTSKNVQDTIEGRTEKRTKTLYVPIGGKKMICFMDDFNMPAKETYGSQPPLELIRQWIDYGFWYDRLKQWPISVQKMLLLTAMGPAGGGRQLISERTLSRFNVISMTFPSDTIIYRIFGTMLQQHLVDFSEDLKQLIRPITNATIDLYQSVVGKMLPTPLKMHYLFNLRDISRIFQGLLRSHANYFSTKQLLLRLWIHESFRVFSDRLIDDNDMEWFINEVNTKLGAHFDSTLHNLCPSKILPVFGDFISATYYEDINDADKLRIFMYTQLEEYNNSPGIVSMNLVLFKEAIEHVTRIVRVISQPLGNMLLIGIGGSGRQSLSRLAAYISEFNTFQIEVTKKYKTTEFREDLKTLYMLTGVQNKSTSFLFNDTQVVEENFMEILNNMLSVGEVANLYKSDEFEDIKMKLEKEATKAKILPTTEAMFNFFMERARSNLHIIICMSPIGSDFRLRIRQYPALVNCTTIDWFREWPLEALLEVSNKYLEACKFDVSITVDKQAAVRRESLVQSTEERLRIAVASTFANIHKSVSEMSAVMLTELKRHNYVTPTNYLELVSGFQIMLTNKRNEVSGSANKLRNGLFKIDDTKEKVEDMSEDLKVNQVKVVEFQEQCNEFLARIKIETAEADTQKVSVEEKKQKIALEEEECKVLQESAQKDLDKAMPALDAATLALNSLNRNDLTEVKSYANPPEKVERVMKAVMILLQRDPTWTEAKRQLGDIGFLDQLKAFDKNHIPDRILKIIGNYAHDPELEPEKVGVVSFACKSLILWIRAIERYGKIYKIVGPKIQLVEETELSLRLKQAQLAEAERKLNDLAEKLAQLQRDFEEKSAMQEQLRQKSAQLKLKLERAHMLIDGLAGEQLRWIETVKQLDIEFGYLIGDCLLATAFISYLGPFITVYRENLVKQWKKDIVAKEIPISSEFLLANFLSDATTIREWNIQGLPSDDFSTENGIIVTKGTRWPLIIDPQCQAHKWIKHLEAKNTLGVIDFGQLDYLQTLEQAIQFGKPILLQNVMETLDPALTPILNKALIKQGGQIMIKFNDKLINYDMNFRFFITTKLSNPHYPPEISTKTTLVNFAVKETGLQAQLLGIIVRKERPALEEQKDTLVVNIARNKRTLIDLENEILRMLNESRGSLLDDDELFSTLQISKETSKVVTESLSVAEVTEIEIDIAREAYQPSAKRAAILFFVLMDMARIDPMYQFALDTYIGLFVQSIEKSVKHPNVNERINILNEYHTFSVYRNTCRGLFEMHKLLFSFHMCARILHGDSKLNLIEYNFLLKGGVVLDRQEQIENPSPKWISDTVWDNITELDKLPGFHGVTDSFEQFPREWQEWYTGTEPENVALIGDWENICNQFQKMLFIRSLRPDRMISCITTFIINTLGAKFIEPPVLDLKAVLDESTTRTPLIFVLSPGVDPTSALQQLADTNNMSSKFHILSLGQGQAPIATKLIMDGVTRGHWVFLANCHLSLSWMPDLDKIIDTLQSKKVHRKFRLWLSSSPHPDFPISILQAGIKMTTEPPKGVKANLKRLYGILTEEQFNTCQAQEKYKKLLFSLCFFHAILLERKKFQQLGWNIFYSFNDSDFEVSENLLSIYLDEYPETPWDALKYLIAGVNYGGHVTDDWDRRLLNTYINQYFCQAAISTTQYRLSVLSTHYIPRDGHLQSYLDYVQLLPTIDQPELFGQHTNADIASQITDTRTLFETLLSLQVQSSSGGESNEEKVTQLAADILAKVPEPIDYENTSKLIGLHKTPLDVVLLQEIERYNVLLVHMKHSLIELQKSIKGIVVMSAELEDIFYSMLDGRVPQTWLSTYSSLKPLGSWTRDLVQRIEHFSQWALTTHPPLFFWLAAYTFPTGFLTAVLQTSARSQNIPIDSLSWEFNVFAGENTVVHEAPKDGGVYIKGMFLEGAGWNRNSQCLEESKPMELVVNMPTIHFKPVENQKRKTRGIYQCPTYYFPERSTSFVIAVDLKSGLEPPDFWIKRGTALLLSLSD